MQQYLVVAVTLGTHHCGTYLAKTDTVSPTGSGDTECLRHAFGNVFLIHHERTAVQMRVAESAAYLKFLAYRERAQRRQSSGDRCARCAHAPTG